MITMHAGTFLVVSATLLLAACAPLPPAPPPPPPAAAIVAAIHAAGRNDDSALRVTPLRDPGVAALVDEAHREAADGRYAKAASALDHALQETPQAPDILQERAEMAVHLHHYAYARQLAWNSWHFGPKLGSLCARNWQTVLEMRKLAHDRPGEAAARKQRSACRVKGVVRM